MSSYIYIYIYINNETNVKKENNSLDLLKEVEIFSNNSKNSNELKYKKEEEKKYNFFLRQKSKNISKSGGSYYSDCLTMSTDMLYEDVANPDKLKYDSSYIKLKYRSYIIINFIMIYFIEQFFHAVSHFKSYYYL